jgi:hypothetical protein
LNCTHYRPPGNSHKRIHSNGCAIAAKPSHFDNQMYF